MIMNMKLLFYFLTLSQLVSASIDQAETYFHATLFEKAISEYENSLKNRPSDQLSKEQLLHFAQSYYALERYEEAIRLLERQPEEESVLYFLGLAYRQAGQTEKALACFSHFLLADNPKAIQERGKCQLALGKL